MGKNVNSRIHLDGVFGKMKGLFHLKGRKPSDGLNAHLIRRGERGMG